MTVAALTAPNRFVLPEGLPDGTHWPTPDTVVLRNRPLRNGVSLSALSRFADDRWDLNPAIFEDHARSQTLNFEIVPAPLRMATKFYIWQLINNAQARTMRRSTARLSVHSIEVLFYGSLQHVLRWLAVQGITEFCQVTSQMLWGYLDAMEDEQVSIERRYRRITEVRRLWIHRDVLPPYLRLPEAPPWDGEDTQALLKRRRSDGENRTRRIGEHTMQGLLSWAVRFVEVFNQDIIDAWDEYQLLRSRNPERRRGKPRRHSGELQDNVVAYIERLRSRGGSLPGRRRDDGTLEPAWSHIAALLDCNASFQNTGSGRLVKESGLPISDQIYLDRPTFTALDGQPWLPRITVTEAPQLARLLSTACCRGTRERGSGKIFVAEDRAHNAASTPLW